MVVNGFLQSPKFDGIYQSLVTASQMHQMTLEVKTNDEMMIQLDTIPPHTYDFILFWDKDVHLARLLENAGFRVFNSASSILRCDDKAMTYVCLQSKNIPMPKTILAPKTFTNIGYPQTEFLTGVVKKLGLPLVLKECFGSFGQQVYLIKTKAELVGKVKQLAGVPMVFQELIETSYGRDIRLNVVGDQVVASMLRYSTNGDFRSNLTLGGSMKAYTPSIQEEMLAIESVQCLGLDFGGVDILFGECGPLVCEVNSNAHFQTTMACTGVNMAEKMMDYIWTRVQAR